MAANADARRDPICGMRGVIESRGYWFCSQRCVDEFVRRQSEASCPTRHSAKNILSDPWFWVPLSGFFLAALGSVWTKAAPVSAIYRSYIRVVAWPVILGLVIGGLVDHFIPKEYIIKLLAGSKKRVILRSAMLGFLASTCSHGCLALSLELYRKGASVPAVVSFLLASPWASMPLTFMLFSFFGLKGGLIVIGALLIAILTGLIFQQLHGARLIEINPNTSILPDDFSIRRDLSRRWREHSWTRFHLQEDLKGILRGMVPLGRMMLGWVQIGLVISAVSGGLIAHAVFGKFLGPSSAGLLCTMVLAAVIEVCSEGTAPFAFELYRQTGAFGNSFAFLMGGVVTDYTELGALWMTIGRKTVLWLIVITLPIVYLTGFLMNQAIR